MNCAFFFSAILGTGLKVKDGKDSSCCERSEDGQDLSGSRHSTQSRNLNHNPTKGKNQGLPS